MTRENGEGLYGTTDPGFKKRDLKKREEIINGSLADLCISIHLQCLVIEHIKNGGVYAKEIPSIC